jgi:hypothetical protein
MGPLEAHRHRLSPSRFTVEHREGPYHKLPQMKICDRVPRSAPFVSRLRSGAVGFGGG